MNKLLLIFLIVVGSAYSVIAVAAHYQFRTFGWDLGYFDQIIWLLSRGFYPFSTLNKVNFLANSYILCSALPDPFFSGNPSHIPGFFGRFFLVPPFSLGLGKNGQPAFRNGRSYFFSVFYRYPVEHTQ